MLAIVIGVLIIIHRTLTLTFGIDIMVIVTVQVWSFRWWTLRSVILHIFVRFTSSKDTGEYRERSSECSYSLTFLNFPLNTSSLLFTLDISSSRMDPNGQRAWGLSVGSLPSSQYVFTIPLPWRSNSNSINKSYTDVHYQRLSYFKIVYIHTLYL